MTVQKLKIVKKYSFILIFEKLNKTKKDCSIKFIDKESKSFEDVLHFTRTINCRVLFNKLFDYSSI